MNGTPIVPCSNFTFISGAGGGTIRFPWVGFDAAFKEADLVIESKLVSSGNVDVAIEASTDTTMPSPPLGTTNISTDGPVTTAITSGLLQLVRLVISSAGAAGVTLTVTLVPKHD